MQRSKVVAACIFADRSQLDICFIPVYLVSGCKPYTCLPMKFMRRQTEADPCGHTPELWRWSSCPSQYCGPSSQHHQFPVQNRAQKTESVVATLHIYQSNLSPGPATGNLWTFPSFPSPCEDDISWIFAEEAETHWWIAFTTCHICSDLWAVSGPVHESNLLLVKLTKQR